MKSVHRLVTFDARRRHTRNHVSSFATTVVRSVYVSLLEHTDTRKNVLVTMIWRPKKVNPSALDSAEREKERPFPFVLLTSTKSINTFLLLYLISFNYIFSYIVMLTLKSFSTLRKFRLAWSLFDLVIPNIYIW